METESRRIVLTRDIWIAGWESFVRNSARPTHDGPFFDGWHAAERCFLESGYRPTEDAARAACPIGRIDHTGYVAVRVGRRWVAVYVDPTTGKSRIQTSSRYYFRTGTSRLTIEGADLRSVVVLSRWSGAMTFASLGDVRALHPDALRLPDGDSSGVHPCSGIVPSIALEHRKGA